MPRGIAVRRLMQGNGENDGQRRDCDCLNQC